MESLAAKLGVRCDIITTRQVVSQASNLHLKRLYLFFIIKEKLFPISSAVKLSASDDLSS